MCLSYFEIPLIEETVVSPLCPFLIPLAARSLYLQVKRQCGVRGRPVDFGVRPSWVQVPAPGLTSGQILPSALSLAFLVWKKGDNKRSFPWAVVKLKHDDDGKAPSEGPERLSYTCGHACRQGGDVPQRSGSSPDQSRWQSQLPLSSFMLKTPRSSPLPRAGHLGPLCFLLCPTSLSRRVLAPAPSPLCPASAPGRPPPQSA